MRDLMPMRRNERGVCVSELAIVKREPNSELYRLCNNEWAWVCPRCLKVYGVYARSSAGGVKRKLVCVCFH